MWNEMSYLLSIFSGKADHIDSSESDWKPFKRNAPTEFSGILDHIHQILNAVHYHTMNVNI